MISSIIKRLSVIAFLFFTTHVYAAEGTGFNLQLNKDWFSVQMKYKNQFVPKIFTRIEGGVDPVFTLEFFNDEILTAVVFSKTGTDIGTQQYKEPIKTQCFFRVDKNPVYEAECIVGDDKDSYIIGLIDENLDNNLLNQFKAGSKLRIKVAPYDQQKTPLYLKFSLKGFSSAYKRALELKNEDAQFFE
ncbi:invasion associated locus B family protein [Succinivibrio dextrinosolvens]|uniref:invasion associated locus B family protein n=1 Tax=Succinivibrio dextrinosolvens TaxID=83771 RepID=UPI00241DD94C|nr:invasion associated locus B family protein [Succinivibrio dextrinosolvens]MBE6422522.1 hypothetical protein [Succinivibrio dextrinosolvens]